MLASMVSPFGAIIQAAATVWNFVQFGDAATSFGRHTSRRYRGARPKLQRLMDQLSRLFDLVKTVVNAIDKIVRGVLGPAKEKVEAVDQLKKVPSSVDGYDALRKANPHFAHHAL